MKGKWAKGIPPRFFAWIIKDKLAVSERPGGYARNHRRVRRQEEILWLRGEGFTRVVSLLTSPHNLHAYDELGMRWAQIPFGPHDDPYTVLPDLYAQLREWTLAGERLLVHQEEVNDRLMGVVAGYLRWSRLVPDGPQAITVVERILQRQMGPDGRELVALAPDLGVPDAASGPGVRGRTSEDYPVPPPEAPSSKGSHRRAGASTRADQDGGPERPNRDRAAMAPDQDQAATVPPAPVGGAAADAGSGGDDVPPS